MPVKKHAHFEIRNAVSRDPVAACAKVFLAPISLTKVCSKWERFNPKSTDLCEVGKTASTRRVCLLQRAFRGAGQNLISAGPLRLHFTARCEWQAQNNTPYFPRVQRQTPYISFPLCGVGEHMFLEAFAVPWQLCWKIRWMSLTCPVSQLCLSKKDGGLYIHKYI